MHAIAWVLQGLVLRVCVFGTLAAAFPCSSTSWRDPPAVDIVPPSPAITATPPSNLITKPAQLATVYEPEGPDANPRCLDLDDLILIVLALFPRL